MILKNWVFISLVALFYSTPAFPREMNLAFETFQFRREAKQEQRELAGMPAETPETKEIIPDEMDSELCHEGRHVCGSKC